MERGRQWFTDRPVYRDDSRLAQATESAVALDSGEALAVEFTGTVGDVWRDDGDGVALGSKPSDSGGDIVVEEGRDYQDSRLLGESA
jgi:hypothetical protein